MMNAENNFEIALANNNLISLEEILENPRMFADKFPILVNVSYVNEDKQEDVGELEQHFKELPYTEKNICWNQFQLDTMLNMYDLAVEDEPNVYLTVKMIESSGAYATQLAGLKLPDYEELSLMKSGLKSQADSLLNKLKIYVLADYIFTSADQKFLSDYEKLVRDFFLADTMLPANCEITGWMTGNGLLVPSIPGIDYTAKTIDSAGHELSYFTKICVANLSALNKLSMVTSNPLLLENINFLIKYVTWISFENMESQVTVTSRINLMQLQKEGWNAVNELPGDTDFSGYSDSDYELATVSKPSSTAQLIMPDSLKLFQIGDSKFSSLGSKIDIFNTLVDQGLINNSILLIRKIA